MDESIVQRRRTPRFAFEAIQRIAPVTDNKKPDPGDFFPVRCRDISRGGFSFYLNERPDFTELMALVSDNHKCIYLMAQVVYVRELENHDKGRFLVGCRFLSRLNSSSRLG
ncbi:PilZ domain-containing protein [Thermogutta sp.]|uniref:PilZ domain-containing protein n=1 Tax=Thermogutta sp. TaxID=1962930 RepID=UPI00321FE2AF